SRDEGTFTAMGLDALAFWSEGLAKLPTTWDRKLPEALAGLRVRRQPIAPQLSLRRTANGWFAVDFQLLSEGVEARPESFIHPAQDGFATLRDGSVAPVEPGAIDTLAQAWVDLTPDVRDGEIPPWLSGPLADLVKLAEEVPFAHLKLDAEAAEALRRL